MHVREVMSRDVRIASPDHPIRDAAKLMAKLDTGFLPVGENDRLIGAITDRDIAIRAVADGRGPDTPIRDVMSKGIEFCFEDEDAEKVCQKMGKHQVRRLAVLNHDKRLVGVVSLGDFAMHRDDGAPVGKALEGISHPGGHKSQTGARA